MIDPPVPDLVRVARRWWPALLVVAAAAALLLGPRLTYTEVELRLSFAKAGERWSVARQATGGPENGFWIDLPAASKAAAPVTTAQPLRVKRRMPSGAARWELRWHDSTRASVAVERARLETLFFGLRLSTATLEGEGAAVQTAEPAGAVWLGTTPRRPWLIPALGVFAAELAAGMAVAVLWWAAGWTARVRVPAVGARAARIFTVAAALISAALPAWMASWSPALIEGDGTAYIWSALTFLRDPSFAHFDGWRLPGYGVFLAPFVAMPGDPMAWACIGQGVLAFAGSLLVFDLARRRLPAPWPQVCMVLVAIDPALLAWQRLVMAESLTAFLLTLGVWLMVRAGEARGRWGWGATAAATALGLLIAGGCYVRANFQVVLVLAPLGIVAGGWAVSRFGAVTRGLLCFCVAAGCLAPFFVHNRREFGRAELAIGAYFNKFLFSWQNGVIDYNQTAGLSFEGYRTLRAATEGPGIHDWDVTRLLDRVSPVPIPAGTHWWTARDMRCEVMVRESLARNPALAARRAVTGVACVLGVRVQHPWYYNGESARLTRVVRGHLPYWGTTNISEPLSNFPEHVQDTLRRSAQDVTRITGSTNAKVLGAMFNVERETRTVWAVFFVLACVALVRRADWAFASIGVIIVAHAGAIAVLQCSGQDRYGMPFYGLMTLVTLVGLFGWHGAGVGEPGTGRGRPVPPERAP